MMENKPEIGESGINLIVGGRERHFKIVEAPEDQGDICINCSADGIGKYTFDKKTGTCPFANSCDSSLLGNNDNAYLREVIADGS